MFDVTSTFYCLHTILLDTASRASDTLESQQTSESARPNSTVHDKVTDWEAN